VYASHFLRKNPSSDLKGTTLAKKLEGRAMAALGATFFGSYPRDGSKSNQNVRKFSN